jgi:hypothetical protein
MVCVKRRPTMRCLVIAAATPLAILAAAAPAAADTIRIPADPTRLHVINQVDVADGEAAHIQARLEATDADARMLVEQRVVCSDNGVWSTQNTSSTRASAVVHTRRTYIGPGTCDVVVRSLIPGSAQPHNATFEATSTVTSTPAPLWTHDWTMGDSKVINPRGQADVLQTTYTADEDQFTVTADVQLTNCYDLLRECDTNPANRRSSTVGSRLQVMQIAAGGGYCRVTQWPATGFDKITVTWDQHHNKNYHRVPVVVSEAAGCTERFRIKVFVRHLSGNPMMVEGSYGTAGPYSNGYLTR